MSWLPVAPRAYWAWGSMSGVDTGLSLGLPRGWSFPHLLPSSPSSSLYTCTKDETFTYPWWRIEFWTEAGSKSPGPLNGNSSHPEVQLSSWFYCVSRLGVGGLGAQLFGVHSPWAVCGVQFGSGSRGGIGLEEALLILLLGVPCVRRQGAGRAAWSSEFPWPKTVSWNHGLTCSRS